MSRSTFASTKLFSIINDELSKQEFTAKPSQKLFLRAEEGFCKVVGIRLGKTNSGKAGAIFFMLWTPELEEELRVKDAPFDSKNINTIAFGHELSPIAPLQNTYWWPYNDLNEDEEASLRRQLKELVIPYFDTFNNLENLIEPLLSCENDFCRKAAQNINQKILFDSNQRPERGKTQRQNRYLEENFNFLLAPPYNFSLNDETFWRIRGKIIDMICPYFLGENRFVVVPCAVWHTDLPQGIQGSIPAGVITVASQNVIKPNDTSEETNKLWFIGNSPNREDETTLLIDNLKRCASTFFATINTKEDVISKIDPMHLPYLGIEQ